MAPNLIVGPATTHSEGDQEQGFDRWGVSHIVPENDFGNASAGVNGLSDGMTDYARLVPSRATICAVCVAGVAMAMRDAWPLPAETFVLSATIVCIYGTLRSKRTNVRTLFAGLWVVAVLANAVMIDPPQVLLA